ncbi:hypothetical protein ADIARSV_2864 [Arcticibacter svalbardensis MN12-7]|uniref:Capsule assembly Wzi family protein n=1 Tax=Arcticibacter svalbardensis MN12-7 TaxID=1150600 RepID=R9GR51_9SPHI|nr:hypothetical protein [Arcticibacter svalbardensis]EOR94030.1 hypothetical protein ADIARSV_2864 [Arcticibacter svalbardensis MN12-7]
MKYKIVLLLWVAFSIQAFSQSTPLPVLNSYPDVRLHQLEDFSLHTAAQPLLLRAALRDSILQRDVPVSEWQSKNWLFRKIFTQHLVEIKNDEYVVNFDFLPDLWVGKQDGRTIWNNTRELAVDGHVGDMFSFNATISENQGVYPTYYNDYIRNNKVVPGQGHAKTYGADGFDYSNSSASLSYTPSKYINVQVGYGKNFIGNGYRSLLLSDYAFNYPYLKVTGTLGRVQYTAMWAQFEDLYDIGFDDETPYDKKYGVFHYLDWNVNKRLSLGVFENVMWAPRGLDLSYAIPVLVLRPTEYNNGSPDKVVLGLNGSYKLNKKLLAYGQFVLNEFTLKEVFAGTGYWANKHGAQVGLRAFDIFQLPNLNATLEYNAVRPYTYSASHRIKNYGHYNEPLAHPFGANFREYLALVNYRYSRWELSLQGNVARYGLDMDGLNYGKNIYLDYTTRVDDYGVEIGHGLKTKFFYANTNVSYLLNPKNNLRMELGYSLRNEVNDLKSDKEKFFTIGLKASFRNKYQDF